LVKHSANVLNIRLQQKNKVIREGDEPAVLVLRGLSKIRVLCKKSLSSPEMDRLLDRSG